MTINVPKALALNFPVLTVDIERGRLRRFAKAIGETDPIYYDVDAAKANGHPDLVVPPTYFFSVYMESPDPYEFLKQIDVDYRYVLHGEQGFVYHALAHAGDTLIVTTQITDVTSKKNGELEVMTLRSAVRRGPDLVAEIESVSIVTNPEGTR